MDIFWERQEGSLCRKHSLNAYFGCAKISTSKFIDYCNQYNNYIFEKYNIKIDITSRDYVLSNDIGIVSYILKKYENIYSFHLPINQIKESIKIMNLKSFKNLCESSDFLFAYNHDHIWGYKKIEDKWKKIDSLSGVSNENNITAIENEKNIGIIIPRNKENWINDYKLIIESIKIYIKKLNKNPNDLNEIRQCVIYNWEKKEMLSYLEPLSGTLINIISCIHPNHGIVAIYEKFLKFFEKNKTDKEFICSWFPLIIDRLLNSPYGKCF